jgi:hypothetical protein
MQTRTLIKLVIVAAVVIVIWKKGLPWLNEHQSTTTTNTSSPDNTCVSLAESASETWGSSIGRFVNPPYDLAAWDDFRSRVEQRIRNAEGKCSCAADSCTTAKAAMNDLRSLVQEMDRSIHDGSPPPSDAVQRQESIDNAINSAHELVRQGK